MDHKIVETKIVNPCKVKKKIKIIAFENLKIPKKIDKSRHGSWKSLNIQISDLGHDYRIV